jgi:hypothetical protein
MSDRDAWERFLQARRDAPPDVVEVTFGLPPECRPLRAESLWARRAGPGLFVLENTPFHVDGVSYRDTVRARLRRGEWRFASVHARSGHSTLRLHVADGWVGSPWPLLVAPLRLAGCSLERGGDRLAAVDVPPEVALHEVVRLLEEGRTLGRWEYEVAHLGHPTS